MALINSFLLTRTIIDIEPLIKAMHNTFQVVGQRLYTDKKGILPDGYTLTLLVLHDDFDYGIDKKTQQPRENNQYRTFDVTVLDRSQSVKKGDKIALGEFDAEHSYAIGYDLLLRFKSLKLLNGSQQNNQAATRNV